MCTVGKLKYKFGNNKHDSFGSASIIKFQGELFIATAAHCLFDFVTNKVSSDVRFEYKKSNKKIEVKVSQIAIPQKWINTQLLTYDYAFGRIELPSQFYPVAFVPVFNFLDNKNKVYVSGYQLNLFTSKFTTKKTYINSQLLKEEGLIGVKAKLKPGVSGGPWYFKNTNNRMQIGVTSAKIKSFKGYIWSAIWTNYTKELLENLKASKDTIFY